MSGPIVLALRVLLALALYLFLGLALWMLWQDLRRTVLKASDRKVPLIRLEVQADHEDARVRAFSQPQVLLGRDPTCDVPLTDSSVSARHALLSFHHAQWWLDDLGSSNGTLLNHEKVETATVLTAGDEIECGRVRVLVTLVGEPPLPFTGAEEERDG